MTPQLKTVHEVMMTPQRLISQVLARLPCPIVTQALDPLDHPLSFPTVKADHLSITKPQLNLSMPPILLTFVNSHNLVSERQVGRRTQSFR